MNEKSPIDNCTCKWCIGLRDLGNAADALNATKEEKLENDSRREQERSEFQRSGKSRINALLFRFLPSDTTVGELDALACDIYDSIDKLFERR